MSLYLVKTTTRKKSFSVMQFYANCSFMQFCAGCSFYASFCAVKKCYVVLCWLHWLQIFFFFFFFCNVVLM
ncbi:hypothetical protein Pint_09599 [Pistacia integerrima]|uniref:Uncharacterized protein n=1 Tax=Pistacia integerrima TaxID=434235 RepID=A0ACC0XN42_9ROSI|nr:hypothetical protein Pint_09599 [Pistacia integerrima]